MRRSLILAASACAFAVAVAPHFARAAEAPTLHGLPICTVVAVEMVESVDSGNALPGDFFRFQTINAVTAGKHVVIPQRTMGYGIVAVGSPAGKGGRPGTLVLEPRYLDLPDGTHLGVVLDHHSGDLERSGSTGSVPGYLGAIPIPGVGAAIGIFNYFHNGKNIVVKRGTIFPIFPSDSPDTERCQDAPAI